MEQNRIEILLARHLLGKIDNVDTAELNDWLEKTSPSELDKILERLDVPERFKTKHAVGKAFESTMEKKIDEIEQSELGYREVDEVSESKHRQLHIGWVKYAAVLILAVAGWFLYKKEKVTESSKDIAAVPIRPGGDHATLTVNGQQIILDSVTNGMQVMNDSVRFLKQNGMIDYSNVEGEKTTVFSTLATPRGGQYRLVLPDGTKVWLDAASSITYPTAFNDNKRAVSVSGQVYFEVVHNADKPFEVRVGNKIVHDIGTAFNINSYGDEPTESITLVEGSIAVEAGSQRPLVLNKPGVGAAYNGEQVHLEDVDLAAVLAWKNGMFHLDGADIASVMRQLSRWYDIEVIFENGIPPGHISGGVPRNTSLPDVLKVLQTSGVHFRVEERKIIVTP